MKTCNILNYKGHFALNLFPYCFIFVHSKIGV